MIEERIKIIIVKYKGLNSLKLRLKNEINIYKIEDGFSLASI